ncbi:MAG TPA: 16S rRNA (cytidine(1402)-2'-O)-methyltransferase [Candidatus Cloacimonadota bacterium]|nr:16S rRNA (cytidine(1402)-2'-O)-methyltransferase [Candidatus Cloacimonadota bacterium]HOQ81106.1 16S rRNA (cytidine(1402)-2'-O)-methyltransferase [Candidatus Cloacimonadota bacterium]HPK40351.1 16S rRNA (cytidine(1402)-2'-O)-methyltransferase [Candidatus Cloacimonadota bacterium]
MPKSVLYVVATPIGNVDDITLRAIKTLESADIVIGEERRVTARFLKSIGVNKPIIEVNEHTKSEEIKSLVNEMLMSAKVYAQVSDCGTPSFEDPGVELVQRAAEFGISVIPIPGVSSLMTLIMVAGIPMKKFYYAGFLSPKKEIRQSELKALFTKYHDSTNIVLLDTPYRLQSLLDAIGGAFPNKTEIILGYKMTMLEEKILRFCLAEREKVCQSLPKGEYVLIIKMREGR